MIDGSLEVADVNVFSATLLVVRGSLFQLQTGNGLVGIGGDRAPHCTLTVEWIYYEVSGIS